MTNAETNEIQKIPLTDTKYIGGFIGQQTGTVIQNSEVKNSNYTVYAEKYGGGFVGIGRDEKIRSTITDIGLDLPNLPTIRSKSLTMECGINK